MNPFVGRKFELERLHDVNQRNQGCLTVITGRRRIGKSRLIEEFAKNKTFLSFSGLAPIKGVTAQDQRDAFARQFAEHFKLPPFFFKDWSDGFAHLSNYLTSETTVILFDEISWMGTKDPTFLPKLKVFWDLVLQKKSNVMLILCGSVSTWIEKNIINSTAFFGRISLHLVLKELSLSEASEFLKLIGFQFSVYDTFKILSVTGGVPWYLEQIIPSQTADENLKHLCFEKKGLFVEEFDHIFHDLFRRKGLIYKKIIHALSDGMKDLDQIRSILKYSSGGTLSKHIKILITSGFVTQHADWSLKTGKLKRQSLYRLSDNYLRFYIKYIEPNLQKIESGNYQEMTLSALPGWEAMLGIQVENLILNNRHLILKALGISPEEIVMDNPYIQHKTTRQAGCQIDYLIQTHANNLFVCEFKFQRREIQTEIIESISEKIKRFSVPKGFGVSPVLIHLGGISNSVHEKRFFYRIIDMTDFLKSSS
ncbi:MAG: AAA family ATPase [Proteobacteria bacterium]|nr:AAA family ATPase [Pseudomonadota bacterium]